MIRAIEHSEAYRASERWQGSAQTALLSAKKLSGGWASSGVNPGLKRNRVAQGTEDSVRLAHIDVDVRVVPRGDSPIHMNSFTPVQTSGTPRSFLNVG